MEEKLRALLDKVRSTADFFELEFTDVHTTNSMGDNALHCAAVWGDLDAAQVLVEAGININQYGDLGFTPLHIACMSGNLDLVRYLVQQGADLFAHSDGDVPFTTARLGGNDQICDYLGPLMKKAVAEESGAYTSARIAQLKREIARLEATLGSNHSFKLPPDGAA
jgi:ankyrin repeat protein